MTESSSSKSTLLESMGLKNRKKSGSDIEGASLVESGDDGKGKGSRSYYSVCLVVVVILCGALLLAVAGGDIRAMIGARPGGVMGEGESSVASRSSYASLSTTKLSSSGTNSTISATSIKDHFGNLKLETSDKNVKLALQIDGLVGNDNASLGPHQVQLSIDSSCKSHTGRIISMRLTRDALISIPLQPNSQNDLLWTASFAFPVQGKYDFRVVWNGCKGTINSPFTSLLLEPLTFGVPAANTAGNGSKELTMVQSKTPLPIFPPGFWLSKEHSLFADHKKDIKSNYIWMTQEKMSGAISTLYQAQSSLGASTVVQEGNPYMKPDSFRSLSNYEVVCWVGTQNPASLSRETFLSMRTQVAPSQRQFKFHYNRITDLANPETSMTERRTNRKCKQIWVMLDDTDEDSAVTMQLSQADYKKHVVNFLKGLASCMHDETWSVWMFTVNTNSTKMCHSPTLPKTHHHPCNDALFEIFDEAKFKDTGLPKNVRLVDNTDITNPAPTSAADVAATIAMRLFALISLQVDTWRTAGQIGKVDGLHRGGKVENDASDDCHF